MKPTNKSQMHLWDDRLITCSSSVWMAGLLGFRLGPVWHRQVGLNLARWWREDFKPRLDKWMGFKGETAQGSTTKTVLFYFKKLRGHPLVQGTRIWPAGVREKWEAGPGWSILHFWGQISSFGGSQQLYQGVERDPGGKWAVGGPTLNTHHLCLKKNKN